MTVPAATSASADGSGSPGDGRSDDVGTAAADIESAAFPPLVRALAVELAPLRVNAVSPGWVDTSIWADVAGERKDEMLAAMAQRLPVGRVGQPQDIADAIGFLLHNRFTTGTVLHVEGGHRLV